MKIYLIDHNTGGWSNESHALIGYNRHLIGASAKIQSMGARPSLEFLSDSDKIKYGELK